MPEEFINFFDQWSKEILILVTTTILRGDDNILFFKAKLRKFPKKCPKGPPFGFWVKCPVYSDTNCNCSHPSRLKPTTQKLILL